jgi:hypothetical protein
VGQGSGGLGSSPPENRDRWSWLYGLCCGVAGAASAAVLDHTWLKQYTAEAFVAVALALLLARVERSWSWRSLAAYAGAGIAGFLASNTAPLVSAAGLVTLARLGLGRRAAALLAVAGLLVVAVLLVPGRVRAGRGDIPGDDVKAQVADVLARSRPGDAVVVTFGATFVPTTVKAAVSFMPTFPGRPELVLVHQPRSGRAAVEGLDRGLRLGQGRVWVVTGSPVELAALRRRAEGVRFVARPGRATVVVAARAGRYHRSAGADGGGRER